MGALEQLDSFTAQMMRETERIARQQSFLIESWLGATLASVGLGLDRPDEIRARCLLVHKSGPWLVGEPKVDEYEMHLDGVRVGQSLLITSAIVMEQP